MRILIIKAFTRMLFLLLVMAALLFIPAGTLKRWGQLSPERGEQRELPRRQWRGRLRPSAGPRRAITISAMMLSSAVAIR